MHHYDPKIVAKTLCHSASGLGLTAARGCRASKMSHDGFDARCDRVFAEGFSRCAENVAYNWPPQLDTTTYDTHVDWMNSDGHRKNILNEELTDVGYGWYICAALSGEQERVYWTGFFGKM